ncbi:MAG: amino acid permease [Candidatus Omnitrophica bacterium]|nr:amino acid permease [Candidatus Omnitrophota bacterium]
MAENHGDLTLVKPKLGLMGAAMNAMALIAPGAFLWMTFQLQAAATAPSGASVAGDLFAGIALALGICFLTALSYAELAKIYPEAGFASCVYFAEKAFLDARKEKVSGPVSMARMAKLATGWAAHLFYWVYPGVMAAMMATLIGYIYTQFTTQTLSIPIMTTIAVAFTIVTGYIAYRGVTGSTLIAIWINIIQWVTLAIFTVLAIWYRLANPQHAEHWAFSGPIDIIGVHSIQGVLVQSTIAILILVGFESCTALSAETKDPEKTIPKAIIIALIVQGLFAYFIEYFGAAFMVSEKLVNGTGTTAVTGMAAAAASGAPIGDLVKLIGDSLIPGFGFALMMTMAFTVVIAIIGTTLSCFNTAMRVTAGVAADRELPASLGYIHLEHITPHVSLSTLVLVTSIIAAIGVRSVTGLMGITLASNLGTFILYGLTCIWTIVAYKNRADFNFFKHGLIPVVGVITNVIMAAGILYLYIIGNADAKAEAMICFMIAGGWALVSIVYIMVTTVGKTYKMKLISAMIRPEQLNILVQALKEDDCVIGMTITKVKGFGRQKGQLAGSSDQASDSISFIPKTRVDLMVKEWDVPQIMDIIREAACTGNVGDGKIIVTDATDAMRIRTGETGIWAV